MKPVYDQIGKGYSKCRCADRRIVRQLVQILDLSLPAIIADIGAGTGNYGRALADLGFKIEAVEPSDTMRQQAVPHKNVHWHSGTAEQIPLPDHSVDAVVCVLAVHHFTSLPNAILEMNRICKKGPIVWLTFDPREADTLWLADYFPMICDDAFAVFPGIASISHDITALTFRKVSIQPFMVPHDLEDCFMAVGWRRPDMYLDPEVRACISAFALADPVVVQQGLLQLRRDIETNVWKTKYSALTRQETIDWGYRFLKII